MKAIVVKNNEFQTIGFEITGSAKILFQWGISPMNKNNFQKEIDTNDWITEIFTLVKLQGTISEQREFIRNFFKVASGQHLLKDPNKGANFKEFEEELKRNEEKMENIIKNII